MRVDCRGGRPPAIRALLPLTLALRRSSHILWRVAALGVWPEERVTRNGCEGSCTSKASKKPWRLMCARSRKIRVLIEGAHEVAAPVAEAAVGGAAELRRRSRAQRRRRQVHQRDLDEQAGVGLRERALGVEGVAPLNADEGGVLTLLVSGAIFGGGAANRHIIRNRGERSARAGPGSFRTPGPGGWRAATGWW